jgi:hypothetical protein
MQTFTWQEITRRLGISPDDLVRYHQRGNKGIIELELKSSEKSPRKKGLDITQDPVFKMEGYESDAPARFFRQPGSGPL